MALNNEKLNVTKYIRLCTVTAILSRVFCMNLLFCSLEWKKCRKKKRKENKRKKKGVGAANRPAMTSALSRCFSFPARGYDNRSCSHFRSCKICMILQSFYSEARTKYYPTTIAAHQRQTSYFW